MIILAIYKSYLSTTSTEHIVVDSPEDAAVNIWNRKKQFKPFSKVDNERYKLFKVDFIDKMIKEIDVPEIKFSEKKVDFIWCDKVSNETLTMSEINLKNIYEI